MHPFEFKNVQINIRLTLHLLPCRRGNVVVVAAAEHEDAEMLTYCPELRMQV